MDIFIRHVRMCDPASGTDGIRDIFIRQGKIEAVAPELAIPADVAVLDAEGLTAFPGLTDIHCHFRDPGWPEKETIETGSQAALAGGVTTVVCMANTKPAVDRPETLRYILDKAEKLPIRLLQNSAMTVGLQGKELVDAPAMLSAGACGFSDDGIPITDPHIMEQALKTVSSLGAILSVHEELPPLIFSPGVNYGPVSKAANVGGAPAVSEAALVERDLAIQKETGGHLHFQHISSARSLELIRAAKAAGQEVTAEVTPQHLALTDKIVLSAGTAAKVNPPIRSEEDRQALIAGVIDGTVDVIATDHAPHTAAEKEKGLLNAPSGLIGLETSLSVAFATLVVPGLISRLRLAELMCCRGAELYGLHKRIAAGETADLTLFDENRLWIPTQFHSKSSNTPFLGQELRGKVTCTICGGQLFRFED